MDDVQATPLTGLQVASSGGFGPLVEDEQATSAARAAADPIRPKPPWRAQSEESEETRQSQKPSPNTEERPVVFRGAITFLLLLLTLAYSWAVAGVSVKRGTGVDAAEWRTGSHQSGPIRG
jgi:hypothetical protein